MALSEGGNVLANTNKLLCASLSITKQMAENTNKTQNFEQTMEKELAYGFYTALVSKSKFTLCAFQFLIDEYVTNCNSIVVVRTLNSYIFRRFQGTKS